MLEPRSFDVYKNSAALMIAMLGHWEIDMEVSSAGMKTIEFNNYREMSGDNGDANGILTIIWEGARFFGKDEQKFINPFI